MYNRKILVVSRNRNAGGRYAKYFDLSGYVSSKSISKFCVKNTKIFVFVKKKLKKKGS